MISDKDRVKLLQEMVLRYQEEVEQLHKEMAELIPISHFKMINNERQHD